MKTPIKILIVAALAVAVLGAVALKQRKPSREAGGEPPIPVTASRAKLPKLLDLGADKCIPCKLMAPILEELKKEYAGQFEVVFLDVWKNEQAGKQYGVEMIPTQIFFDASGKELFRHVGFYGKEDILRKWKELGVDVGPRTGGTAEVREKPEG